MVDESTIILIRGWHITSPQDWQFPHMAFDKDSRSSSLKNQVRLIQEHEVLFVSGYVTSKALSTQDLG